MTFCHTIFVGIGFVSYTAKAPQWGPEQKELFNFKV